MDLTELSIAELEALADEIALELEHRRILQDAPVLAESLALAFLRARDGEPDPANPPVWVRPTGSHNAYPMDYVVTHNGKIYISIQNGSHAEPGLDNGHSWMEVVSGEEPAWGVGQVVAVGDIRTHIGHRWEALVAHTTHLGWEPGPASYAIWKDLGVIPA